MCLDLRYKAPRTWNKTKRAQNNSPRRQLEQNSESTKRNFQVSGHLSQNTEPWDSKQGSIDSEEELCGRLVLKLQYYGVVCPQIDSQSFRRVWQYKKVQITFSCLKSWWLHASFGGEDPAQHLHIKQVLPLDSLLNHTRSSLTLCPLTKVLFSFSVAPHLALI